MPSKPRAQNRSNQLAMPRWATTWAIVGSLVCLWDATYVLLRPRTMAKGDLFDFYLPYAKYITVDPLYGNLQNAFVLAQSWVNLLEITMALTSVVLYHLLGRRNLACLLLLIASVMTWSKTVLYFIHDYFHRPLHPQDPSIDIAMVEHIFLFVIPSLIWIVFPLACIWTVARQIVQLLGEKTKSNIA